MRDDNLVEQDFLDTYFRHHLIHYHVARALQRLDHEQAKYSYDMDRTKMLSSVSGDGYSDVLKGVGVFPLDRGPLAAPVVCKERRCI